MVVNMCITERGNEKKQNRREKEGGGKRGQSGGRGHLWCHYCSCLSDLGHSVLFPSVCMCSRGRVIALSVSFVCLFVCLLVCLFVCLFVCGHKMSSLSELGMLAIFSCNVWVEWKINTLYITHEQEVVRRAVKSKHFAQTNDYQLR